MHIQIINEINIKKNSQWNILAANKIRSTNLVEKQAKQLTVSYKIKR